jgi:RNA polymerase sigma factor (sigma-70 family)
MSDLHHSEVVPPDSGGHRPSDSGSIPISSSEPDRVPCKSTSPFLDWRSRRLDGDPGLEDDEARFYRDFAPLLRVAVGRSRGNALDPEDAAQEAWLVLLSRKSVVGAGHDQEDLPARVVVVIRNHLDDLGRRARRRLSESLASEEADSLVGREEDPAVAYERDRDRALVRAVLEEARGRISEPSHRIILLRGIEGRSHEEIAEILGMPIARVRDRYRRAISDLRDLFIRRFGADPIVFPDVRPDADSEDLDFEEVTS